MPPPLPPPLSDLETKVRSLYKQFTLTKGDIQWAIDLKKLHGMKSLHAEKIEAYELILNIMEKQFGSILKDS
ncbi:hypothetical protein LCGC14_3078590 [marine sediment metagenome]|uniref:Uncharacterized protein n=1 Tax=marine sediment metagenome TaxID=412755 RepID=A0A0F8YLJ4_9ZZZZ